MAKAPTITAEQAARAIYIDFEGNMNEPPSLLGWRCDGASEQAIVEPHLASFAELVNAKYRVSVDALDGILGRLRQRSELEERLIMGFTTHEVRVVNAYGSDEELVEWFGRSYVNVKKPIGRWIRRQVAVGTLPDPGDRSLLAYMTAVGLSYKPGTGPGIVGPGLKRLRTQVARHGTAQATSKGTRIHWWRILSHNITDLEATQYLTERATGGR